MSPAAISIPADQIVRFCQRHGIRRLALFGSALRDDFAPDSGIDDLLGIFEPEQRVGLLTTARLEHELGHLCGGRRVDLRAAGDLSRYSRDQVTASARVLYERC